LTIFVKNFQKKVISTELKLIADSFLAVVSIEKKSIPKYHQRLYTEFKYCKGMTFHQRLIIMRSSRCESVILDSLKRFKSTHTTKHTGRPMIPDPKYNGYNPPLSMSKRTAKRWSKVAPIKESNKESISFQDFNTPSIQNSMGKYSTKKAMVPPDMHEITLKRFMRNFMGFSHGQIEKKILLQEVEVIGSAHARYVEIKSYSKLFAGDVVKVALNPILNQEKKELAKAKLEKLDERQERVLLAHTFK
jgi:hypothetical protein